MSTHKHALVIGGLITLIGNGSSFGGWKDNAKGIDISGGEDHTLVLTANKWPWACGDNGWYQLGIGNNQDQKVLLRVLKGDTYSTSDYLENIDDLDAGWRHSLALDVNGMVWAWGDNEQGGLGNDGFGQYQDEPVQVHDGEMNTASGYLEYIVAISAGRSGRHSLAVDANGYAYAWGYNKYGQCGNDVNDSNEWTPVYVHQGAQADDPNDANEYLKHIVDICAGSDQSIALENDDPSDPNFNGCVYTWGTNMWGDDEYEELVGIADGWGLLGNASDVNFSHTPVRVLSGEQDVGNPNSFLKHIVAVSAGWNHCMALENDDPWDPNLNGRVFTWGHNGPGWGGGDTAAEWERSVGGRLGNGTYNDSNVPVLVLSGEQDPGDPNSPLEHITAISAGEGHSMALDDNGNVYTWGDNQYGQLGNGRNDPCSAPVRVIAGMQNREDPNSPLSGIVAISAGHWHSLAIDCNGVVWVWGKTKDGRLGLADMAYADPCVCAVPHRIPVVYNDTQGTFRFAIQDAIDDANDAGDVLEASPGTYFEDVNFLSKSIVLRSADPNNPDVVDDTVIQGSGSDYIPALEFPASCNSTLTGFTIANDDYGIKCDSSSPTISNSVIANCAGHGLYCLGNSAVEVKNCTISGNGGSVSPNEDGINCSSSEITLSNCLITENAGNGIYCNGSSLRITNSMIQNNECYGICLNGSSVDITKSIIRENGSDSSAAFCGVYCGDAGTTALSITNNWICRNGSGADGSGIYLNSGYVELENVVIRHNTIANNAGYGIETAGIPDINNCIIWGNGSGSLQYNDYNVTYSCVEGGYTGPGNIESDPCFIDADANDFHLASNSPCIDSGDPAFEAEPNETDIDGNLRVIGEEVDMGADEFWATDFSRDGLVNFVDYAMLAAAWHTEPNDANYNDDCDLQDNNNIDFNDLGLFCEEWLLNADLHPGPMPLMDGRGGAGMVEGLGLDAGLSAVASAEREPAVAEPVDIEAIMKWLAEIWLDPDVQKSIDEEKFLKVYESLKQLE